MAAITSLEFALSANSKKLNSDLKRARSTTKKFAKGVSSDFRKVGQLVAGAFTGAALKSVIQSVTTDLDTLAKTITRLGVDSNSFQILVQLNERFDISLQDTSKTLLKLRTNLGKAQQQTVTQVRALEVLGYTYESLNAVTTDSTEQFNILSSAISQIEDTSVQAAVGLDLFGKGYEKFLTVFNDTTGAYEANRKELERLNLVFSEEQLKNVENFSDQLGTLGQAFKVIAGRSLAPLFEGDGLKQLNQFLADNIDRIVKGIQALAVGLGAIIGKKLIIFLVGSLVSLNTASLKVVVALQTMTVSIIASAKATLASVKADGIATTGKKALTAATTALTAASSGLLVALRLIGKALAVFALAALATALYELNEPVLTLTISLGALGLVLAGIGGPITLIVAAAGLLIAAFQALGFGTGDLIKDLKNIGQAVVKFLVTSFRDTVDFLKLIARRVQYIYQQVKAFGTLGKTFTEFNREIDEANRKIAAGSAEQQEAQAKTAAAQAKAAMNALDFENQQTKLGFEANVETDITPVNLNNIFTDGAAEELYYEAESLGVTLGEAIQAGLNGGFDGVAYLVDEFNLSNKEALEQSGDDQQKANNLITQNTVASAKKTIELLATQDKKAFKAHKALQIASASIDTYAAFTKALAASPPPLNFVNAALALAAGLAQVGQIKSQQFNPPRQFGGRVQGGLPGLVGEAGAELFIPDSNGTIVSNDQVENGGFGNSYNNVTIQVGAGASPADVADAFGNNFKDKFVNLSEANGVSSPFFQETFA